MQFLSAISWYSQIPASNSSLSAFKYSRYQGAIKTGCHALTLNNLSVWHWRLQKTLADYVWVS